MDPAQAMGIFLKTWRSEWAGMSQQQLAIAVSGCNGSGKPVTRRMVQHWEAGHPPETSAELVGLCEVMRRNGLWDSEVAQFRAAVMGALCNRQYPELFHRAPLAVREDVDELGRAAYDRALPAAADLDLVVLVAATKTLESAVLGDSAPSPSPAQVRRQRAALPYFRAALAEALGEPWGRRRPMVARLFAQNAEFLQTFFGPHGVGRGGLSVVGQRTMQVWAGAHTKPRSPQAARQLLELAEEAQATDQTREASRAYLLAVHCLGELGEGAYHALAPRAHAHVDLVRETDGHTVWVSEAMALPWAALAEGLDGELDRLLVEYERWCQGSPEQGGEWMRIAAWQAIGRSQYGDVHQSVRNWSAQNDEFFLALQDLGQARGRPVTYGQNLRKTDAFVLRHGDRGTADRSLDIVAWAAETSIE